MLQRLLLCGPNFVSACLIRLDVRFWHLADIDADDEHVCFRGKADIPEISFDVGWRGQTEQTSSAA